MGQEITNTRFRYYDFHRYERHLKAEMELLYDWFRTARFSRRRAVAGLELEAWLVDADGHPTPWNQQVIAATRSADVVPELSRYNVEFNVAPRAIAGAGLSELAAELGTTWDRCDASARELGTSLVAIGVLPTLSDAQLSLKNMSKLHRYHALNEQVLRLRQGRPIRLSLAGRDRLESEHRDVMLEAATTSFQLHLQVPLDASVRNYNAAMIASAPLVAVASNSPFLFGRQLWEETRIPLFEQAVDVGGQRLPRVSFGSGYASESLAEVFAENVEHFPVLLPLALDNPSDRLAHLRLLNGTIWRWNRPLIGFDEDGTPHLRIEHRVMAAGPTLRDMTANMALFYGLCESLAVAQVAPESRLPFAATRDNFYRAARDGLNCEVQWLQGRMVPLRSLLLDELLGLAAEGLQRLQVSPTLIAEWLALIEARTRSGQTGAVWQRRFVERHGNDFAALTIAYRERQRSGDPVHTWSLSHENHRTHSGDRRSELRIMDHLPDDVLAADAQELFASLGGPTLFHLAGRRQPALFVSVLLHGNEDVGWRAIQSLLHKHQGRPLPRALSLLIGNVEAAQSNVRHRPDQPDFNRVWPGSELDDTPTHAVMRHVVDQLRERGVFASVDLHNNTGWNPHYACVTRLDPQHLQLAALFSRTAVYFQRPRGVQTMAFADFTPAVTCECGKVGDESGVRRAAEFLEACLHLSEFPSHPPELNDLHLFQSIATLTIPTRVKFQFAGSNHAGNDMESHLTLRGDLEQLNFQELAVGTCLGWTNNQTSTPIHVTDEVGRLVTDEYLQVDNGEVRLRQGVIPAMLTQNCEVIRQDCLGYLMNRWGT